MQLPGEQLGNKLIVWSAYLELCLFSKFSSLLVSLAAFAAYYIDATQELLLVLRGSSRLQRRVTLMLPSTSVVKHDFRYKWCRFKKEGIRFVIETRLLICIADVLGHFCLGILVYACVSVMQGVCLRILV